MSAPNAPLAMPYPGLRPFEAADQPLFFGREEQVSAMLRQLEDHHFVAVVGSSGSGKSSLVRAGLLPAMREGFLLGTTDWLTLIVKPGHQPYQRLVRALHRATCGAGEAPALPADDDLPTPDETATLATLRRTDRGLLAALSDLAISSETRVMIVVDQFEELFAFRRAGVNRENVASRDEAAAFVGMLLRSAADPAGRVWVVLTMRSDFIGDCEAFLGLPEQISRSQFLVPRPHRGQLEEAIARPGTAEEGTFKTFIFEDGLVNRIINEAGDRPDQLPLMQHALMRTWKRAVERTGANGTVKGTAEDYEKAGGIEKALSRHADAAWDEIKDDPKKAHIARRLFLLLCDISPDGQITRRRPKVDEVQAVTGASVAEIEEVVRVFQQDDRNFLLPPPPLTAGSYLDISHEALLRQWQLFAGEWQEQERRDASELRRLAELAGLRQLGQGGLLPAQDLDRITRWKQRVSEEWARRYVTEEAWQEALSFIEDSQAEVKREEEHRQKQARQKQALVGAVAIILILATGFSVWQMIRALEAKKTATDVTANLRVALSRLIDSDTARIARFRDRFERTGDRTSLLEDLEIAAQGLDASRAQFAQSGEEALAARCAIELGETRRLRENWTEARTAFAEGLARAKNARDSGLQARAEIGLGRSELALKDYPSAQKHFEEAARVGAALADRKPVFDANTYMGQVKLFTGDLSAAADAFNRALALVPELKDQTQALHVHLDRADMFEKLSAKADTAKAWDAALENLNLAQADYEKALAIARQAGKDGLAQMIEGFVRRIDLRKQMVELNRRSGR